MHKRSNLHRIELSAPPVPVDAKTDRLMQIRLESEADGPIQIALMGFVGESSEIGGGGLTAAEVVGVLGENPGRPVNVTINSLGGFAFDGVTIHNALLAHDAEVSVGIEGIAASAAAVVAMAGDSVTMRENSQLMIHRAHGLAVGNTADMEHMAEFLTKMDDQIALTFASRTGLPEADIHTMLAGKVDGTMFNATEAKRLGFVDEVLPLRGKETENAVVAPVETGQSRDIPRDSPALPSSEIEAKLFELDVAASIGQ